MSSAESWVSSEVAECREWIKDVMEFTRQSRLQMARGKVGERNVEMGRKGWQPEDGAALKCPVEEG